MIQINSTDRIVEELDRRDVCVIHEFLSERMCNEVLAYLPRLTFTKAEMFKGPRRVFQNFEECTDVPTIALFTDIRHTIKHTIAQAFASDRPHPLNGRKLALNETRIQRYPASLCGIGIHADSMRFRDIIAVVLLEGDGEFMIYDSHDGANPQMIPHGPGDAIIMAATGYRARGRMRAHSVRHIRNGRITIGFRQNVPDESS